MPAAEFELNIKPSELQKYYRGDARSIIVTSTAGLNIQFPANLLLPYIAHQGITGRFVLRYDINGKALSLKRLA